jgi:hypothetical protein
VQQKKAAFRRIRLLLVWSRNGGRLSSLNRFHQADERSLLLPALEVRLMVRRAKLLLR